ncbi:MAG: alpha-ketoacid dehydrogenase subunit beta [Deltaproteobacteria bacterium]|jgi:pyruvate dehydrogenase E1 component beta subunit
MPWTKLQADAIEREHRWSSQKGDRAVTYRQAIREAQHQALKADPSVFVMGEGVDDPGGVFGTTLDLHKEFGRDRVIDLPLAENGFTGIAIGAAIAGMKPILVHMRMDFLLLSMDQIVNHASKWRYMFGGRENVPLTIRSIIGRGWGSAAQHSQSLHGLFLHVPGLKLVVPSTAYDVKGLLLASIADEDPVMFVEHRWLYDQVDHVPEEMYTIPFGKGRVIRKGADVTVVAISHMVVEALKAARMAEEDYGISCEIVDPRTLRPLDEKTILRSVRKTGRLVIADGAWRTGGASAHLASVVAEKGFTYLKAPIQRVCFPDTPTPAAPALEQAFYPGAMEIVKAAKQVVRLSNQRSGSAGSRRVKGKKQ